MDADTLFTVLEHLSGDFDRARLALRRQPTDAVVEAAVKWTRRSIATEHDQLKPSVLQHHDVVDAEQLKRVLASWMPGPAAGVRVLSAWADRLPNAMELLQAAAVIRTAGRPRPWWRRPGWTTSPGPRSRSMSPSRIVIERWIM